MQQEAALREAVGIEELGEFLATGSTTSRRNDAELYGVLKGFCREYIWLIMNKKRHYETILIFSSLITYVTSMINHFKGNIYGVIWFHND